MTPHGQLGNGVETTKAVGLVMAVSGSTVTVQCPEGVTIPTTGGITSVAYSTQANPYGWVADKGRWEISSLYKITGTSSSSGNYTTFQSSSRALTVPVGSYEVGYFIGRITTTTVSLGINLSPTSIVGVSEQSADSTYSTCALSGSGTGTCSASVSAPQKITTQQTYIIYTVGATTAPELDGTRGVFKIFALPSGL